MAREVTIKYEDGSAITVALKPRNLIAAERMLGKAIDEHGVEATYMAAWNATGSSKRFDDWLEEVDELVHAAASEGDGVDPTPPPETSPEESPT